MTRQFSCFRFFSGLVLGLVLGLVVPVSAAANSFTLGSVEAQECFEESRLTMGGGSVSVCTSAIQKGGMSKRDLAATYSNRGLIHAHNGRLERALRDHDKAVSLSPALAQAWINRGNAYYHLGEYDRALEDYATAIEIADGPLYLPYYNSGLALLKLRRFEDSLAALNRALALSPGTAKILSKIDDLTAVLDRRARIDPPKSE